MTDDEIILQRLREDPRLDYLIAWQQVLALRAIAYHLDNVVSNTQYDLHNHLDRIEDVVAGKPPQSAVVDQALMD